MTEGIRTASGPASKVIPHQAAKASSQGSKPQPITTAQVWLLMRRTLVLAAAVLYIVTMVQAGQKSLLVLYGIDDNSLTYPPRPCHLIAGYAGTQTIRKSNLVHTMGGPDPRNDTMYLLSSSTVDFDSCAKTPLYNTWMYGNDFLRAQYADLVRDTSYNISLFKTTQLVMPIVDCSSEMLQQGVSMSMRVFYLLRSIDDPDEMFLLTYSFSMQDYRFPDQYQTGVAGVLALSVISDMRFNAVDDYYYAISLAYPFSKGRYTVYQFQEDTKDGYRVFESVLLPGAKEPNRTIYTSWRMGVFKGSEAEQSNIKNMNWKYKTNPVDAITDMDWNGPARLHDSWTWTHMMHFAFAADMVFNLLVLLLVIYRNLRKGKLWIGDAFVSVSKSIIKRGLLVLIGWFINGYWTLIELCLHDGKLFANTPGMFIHEEILHADLMVLFISLAGVLGFVLRERIDPALAVFLFEIGFTNRHAIVRWFPSILKTVVDFSLEDTAKGIAPVPPKLAGISPMRFRSVHNPNTGAYDFIFAVLFPVIIMLGVLLVYVPIRKVHRRYYPDRMVQLSRGTNLSTETDAILNWKGTLTMFEVATGAALQNRVGLVTDYDNCVYIKGMKFASADGVFSNGFVVADGKWLLQTTELPLILAIKITGLRFVDVYVYEVSAFTVQKNARLFYPEMMSFYELFQLNTMILS